MMKEIFVNDTPPKFTFVAKGEAIFTIRADGSIERGPAFTTTDAAALEFWDAVERYRRPLVPLR